MYAFSLVLYLPKAPCVEALGRYSYGVGRETRAKEVTEREGRRGKEMIKQEERGVSSKNEAVLTDIGNDIGRHRFCELSERVA